MTPEPIAWSLIIVAVLTIATLTSLAILLAWMILRLAGYLPRSNRT